MDCCATGSKNQHESFIKICKLFFCCMFANFLQISKLPRLEYHQTVWRDCVYHRFPYKNFHFIAMTFHACKTNRIIAGAARAYMHFSRLKKNSILKKKMFSKMNNAHKKIIFTIGGAFTLNSRQKFSFLSKCK